jgi:hypothetical protein
MTAITVDEAHEILKANFADWVRDAFATGAYAMLC